MSRHRRMREPAEGEVAPETITIALPGDAGEVQPIPDRVAAGTRGEAKEPSRSPVSMLDMLQRRSS
jgi:hypothetical protein